jgi:hypothetical protein
MAHLKARRAPSLFTVIIFVLALKFGCAALNTCTFGTGPLFGRLDMLILIAAGVAGHLRFRHRRAAMHSHHAPKLLSQKERVHDDY